MIRIESHSAHAWASFDDDHPYVRTCLSIYASILRQLGRDEEAAAIDP